MARARIRNVEDPPPLQGGPRSLEAWLAWAFRLGASDLHLPPGYPATVRILGEIITVGAPLQPELLQEMLIDALEPAQKREVQRDHSLDLAREVEGAGRFRLSVFRTVRGMSAAIRCIPTEVGSAEALNIPQSTLGLTDFRDGLVLFTGPTGSGKSTTQACLIEHLNRTADLHVLTIEDPIEYLFTSRRCLIQQRELGSHVPTFARGLRDALRENPDVIMVGELRDRDTVDMAMAGAESGHLILATLHTHNTAAAISRLVDIFPDFQRNGARAVLADVCRAVINQRLLPTREGKGIVPAVEMLRINRAVANLIRENKMFQIPQVMATHREEGMVTMERALVDLVRKRLITTDVGWRHAPDKVQFEQALMSSDPRKAKR